MCLLKIVCIRVAAWYSYTKKKKCQRLRTQYSKTRINPSAHNKTYHVDPVKTRTSHKGSLGCWRWKAGNNAVFHLHHHSLRTRGLAAVGPGRRTGGITRVLLRDLVVLRKSFLGSLGTTDPFAQALAGFVGSVLVKGRFHGFVLLLSKDTHDVDQL